MACWFVRTSRFTFPSTELRSNDALAGAILGPGGLSNERTKLPHCHPRRSLKELLAWILFADFTNLHRFFPTLRWLRCLEFDERWPLGAMFKVAGMEGVMRARLKGTEACGGEFYLYHIPLLGPQPVVAEGGLVTYRTAQSRAIGRNSRSPKERTFSFEGVTDRMIKRDFLSPLPFLRLRKGIQTTQGLMPRRFWPLP